MGESYVPMHVKITQQYNLPSETGAREKKLGKRAAGRREAGNAIPLALKENSSIADVFK